MPVLAALAALALLATQAQLERIRWVPNPRVLNGTSVADPSHHLSASTVDTLNAEIGALERATSAEIAVVVVDSTSGLEPFDFALALHRGWGVGKQGRDNGVVFLWVPAQRAVHISVGYGLEGVLPDRRVGRIRDEEIFPAFRRSAFDEGTLAGVRSLAAAVREETSPREGITPRLRGGGETARSRGEGGPGAGTVILAVFGIILGIIGGFLLVNFVRGVWRRRPRRCPNGHGPMHRLNELEDDQHLEEPERLEEKLKSVDYDVWLCDTCGGKLKIPYRRWSSGYHVCKECKRRTVSVKSRTIRKATTKSEGLAHVTETCASCGWSREYDEKIPRVSSGGSGGSSWSSGGGGGGGGSFGGGSAGGGGAGGRY